MNNVKLYVHVCESLSPERIQRSHMGVFIPAAQNQGADILFHRVRNRRHLTVDMILSLKVQLQRTIHKTGIILL